MIIESRLEHILRTNFNRLIGCFIKANRPAIFDIQDTCPQLLQFNENYSLIRAELDNYLRECVKTIPRYTTLDVNIPTTNEEDRDWRVIILHAMGAEHQENLKHFPKTYEILKTIPNLFQAFFSVLDENVSIPAHEGSLHTYLRYHMGMIIPKTNPPTFRIMDHHYQWKEGESILFDDSLDHEVINHADEKRIILIVDILRPLPAPMHQLNKFSRYLTRLFYGKKLLKD